MKTALEILRDEITELCNAISILLARNNCNKNLFQPRVEPDWGRKVFEKKKILPESQKNRSYIDENGNIVYEIIAGIEVSISSSWKIYGKMPADELSGFMRSYDPHYQYVMQEYCAALGTEGVRSKYFHSHQRWEGGLFRQGRETAGHGWLGGYRGCRMRKLFHRVV